MKKPNIDEIFLNYDLLDKLTDNILVMDFNGKILHANAGAVEIFKNKYNDLKNLNIANLFDHKIFLSDLIKEGIIRNSNFCRKDGTKFFSDIKILYVNKEIDRIIIGISKNTCIFENLLDNTIISKSLEIIDEAFVVFTKDLNIYIWSRSAENKFGYKKADIIGKSIKLLIPEDRIKEFDRKYEKLKKGLRINEYRTQRIDKIGNLIDVSISISPLYSCKQEFVGAYGIYKDISEKVNLENKLRESEERLRLALEAGRIGVWDWNISSNTVYTSNLLNELLGYGGNNLISSYNDIFGKIHNDDKERVDKIIKKHFSGEEYDIEFRMKCKDSNYKWFRSRGKVNEWSKNGSPLRMVGTHQDITVKKMIEEDLKEKYKQLEILKEDAEFANNEKSKFLANISHEIRTPLNGMYGMLQLLESSNLNIEQNKYAEYIKDSLQHLTNIINDLLDISKIESGKDYLDEESFDLRKTINGIYSNLLVTGNSKGLEISYYLDPNINFLILSDEMKLKQILNNLISNAVKFTDEGYISFKTKIISENANKVKIEFRVKDTGIGIGEKYKEKLFQYFSQGDLSKNKKYQGTGLGLAISKQLAELFNGDLTFESKEGAGSTFTFICEFKKSSSNINLTHSIFEDTKSDNYYDFNNKYTILCVEDNIINQEVLKNLMVKRGYNYLAAYNGKECISILKENKVDLILMDIQLPELNGFQINTIIKDEIDHENKIPIIAMTAYAMREDREKCVEAGMNDYIAKPYEIESLYEVIEKYL